MTGEIVARLLAAPPTGVRRSPHAWVTTVKTAGIRIARCTACGLVASVSAKGLVYLENSPSGMIYHAKEPVHCVRIVCRRESAPPSPAPAKPEPPPPSPAPPPVSQLSLSPDLAPPADRKRRPRRAA